MQVGINTFLGRNRPYGDLGPAYFRKVIDAVRIHQPETRFTLLTGEHNDWAYDGYDRMEVPPPPAGLGGLFRGHTALAEAIEQCKLDVVLSPIEAPVPKSPCPQVLYALDLAPWEPAPGQPADARKRDTAIGKACAAARAVLVPSEYARRRCGEFFDAPLDRIVVAAPGVSPAFQGTHGSFVKPPFIVIAIDPLCGPGLGRLREAMDQLAKELPHTFVVVGLPLGPEESGDWGPRVVRIEQIPDVHLAGLYQHAALMLYPGLHDATAQRVLEAICTGVPVVAAKTGALAEYCGEVPVYYNAESAGTMLQAIRRVVAEKPEVRNARLREGRRHAAQHTWEKCAWKVLAALKRT